MQPTERDQVLRRVMAALSAILHPTSGEDVVSSGRVRELDVLEDGTVRFRFALQADDPGTLVRQARTAAEKVEGVQKVKIDISLPAAGAPQKKGPLRAGNVPAPTPNANLLPGVSRIIAVSSGKGGVGKSTVAVNLAASLAKAGQRVGLLDADIYGPNVPIMFGETRKPRVVGDKGREKMEPLDAHGVRLMSLGFLLEDEQPAIMRGPMIAGILKQFLSEVAWGELDVLVVDMPPGTGDAQLSLVQTIRIDGVVMVTTPQDVSTGDVLRGIKMFERTNTPVLGVVENMAGFICPCCGQRYEIFGRAGGQRLASQTGLEFLGEVPLEMIVREGGDEGIPVVIGQPESPSAVALREIAERVSARLSAMAPAAV
ncbi:Mrp/NBP35 family ATP-binding protein [Longimicrobium terrae]|uniref:Iron-sulfur cluster carrier protein n=1 Tax=Longimicrobium terrae TaxID=1639882 RepID=A0A841H0B7_9BACT|nr:Mrp/NBP35 family ATP-binding protein [Longimicrobium terrae]MBB4636932.1 ATP-binding protein involved in chromosome partitioning [Longimicrobium terrae]MBB6071460.1 ATP-binding protein involved in chromosome partitioning [Longimicrobium terrae]NNC31323.1 Mrp/NBP35 family ATP-binding protein [Longimicrobium terrae]